MHCIDLISIFWSLIHFYFDYLVPQHAFRLLFIVAMSKAVHDMNELWVDLNDLTGPPEKKKKIREVYIALSDEHKNVQAALHEKEMALQNVMHEKDMALQKALSEKEFALKQAVSEKDMALQKAL